MNRKYECNSSRPTGTPLKEGMLSLLVFPSFRGVDAKRTGCVFFVLLFSLFIFVTPLFAQRARNYVTDKANVLSSGTEQSLNQLLLTLERSSTAEVAVYTVKSLQGDYIESYAVKLFEQLGIGKKDKDNGVLFLIAPKERQLRIEVGYGLEGAITDGIAGQIRDQYVIPNFRQNDYDKGVLEGTIAIASLVAKEYNVDILSAVGINPEEYGLRRGRKRSRLLSNLLYFIFIMIIGGSRFWPMLFFMGGRRSYWHGGGYYRGGGGFSSGFGGFGGGLSGGGGASGSW